MNESNDNAGTRENNTEDVSRLIRLAGRRPRPDAAIEQAVRATLEREWRKTVGQRQRRRHLLAAAAVVLTVGVGWGAVKITRQMQPEWVGTMVSTRGEVRLSPAARHELNASGDALAAGTRIETATGGAALLTIASIGIRIGANSVVDVERRGVLRLEKGLLYVDGGPNATMGDSLQVVTEFGTVTHHGTQYQLRAVPQDYLFAAVREGRIELAVPQGGVVNLTKGDGLRMSASHQITRETLPIYSTEWQWVSDFAPEVSIDGRPLSAFFDWYARETGRSVIFVPPTTRDATERTLLSGSVAGLTPGQALEAVLATTRFRSDLTSPGELRILGASNTATN